MDHINNLYGCQGSASSAPRVERRTTADSTCAPSHHSRATDKCQITASNSLSVPRSFRRHSLNSTKKLAYQSREHQSWMKPGSLEILSWNRSMDSRVDVEQTALCKRQNCRCCLRSLFTIRRSSRRSDSWEPAMSGQLKRHKCSS